MTSAVRVAVDVATHAVAHVESFYSRTGGFTAHQLGKAYGAIETASQIVDRVEHRPDLHNELQQLALRLADLRNLAKAEVA